MTDQAILRRIDDRKAIILGEGGNSGSQRDAGQTFAAYPYGDRRHRPVSWIDHSTLSRMLADGAVEKTPKGYEVVKSAARRTSNHHNPFANQHRDIERGEFSGDDGVFRPANVNRNSKSVLRRLGTHMTTNDVPYLSAAEIEAGERFTADHAKSSLSLIATQNYESLGMNTGIRGAVASGPEDLSIRAIDARKRVLDALAYVGPGLNQAISAVCCQDMGLEEMELTEGWAKRSGKTVLKMGLQRLSEFYGTQAGIAPLGR